jgi:putative 4-mercaptohistidine N1-methyltranferase
VNIYETPRLVAEYLLFHYGEDSDILPWDFGPAGALGFPRRSVSELIDPPGPVCGSRALDLGCAVGRSVYELAAHTDTVIGIDYSHAFIDYAERVRRGDDVPYLRADEGAMETLLEARRPAGSEPGRVSFEQGDAMNLRADLGSFDIVHAANLLCRLTRPALLLERLPDLVKPGGQLLLTTPCTWLSEFTPPENWPLGSTRDWLRDELGRDFDLEFEKDLPFLIREHARKYQWSVALGTRWRRR